MLELTPSQKRQARILVLQATYAFELAESKVESTYELMIDMNKPPMPAVLKYSQHLSQKTIQHISEMDKLIRTHVKNWDFKRIALMDKLILRMMLTEMLYEDSVPPKVSISEGVEIAKEFSTKDSSSFVNGILDSVYNEWLKGKIKTI